jgi:hypothetical protein
MQGIVLPQPCVQSLADSTCVPLLPPQAYAWHVGGRPDVSGCGITSLTGRAAWTRSALLSTSSQMVAEAAHQLASVTSSSGNSSSGRSSGEEDGGSSADDYPDVVQRDALEYLWAPQRIRSNTAARAGTGSGFTAGPGYGSGYQPLSGLHQEPAGRLPRLVFLTGNRDSLSTHLTPRINSQGVLLAGACYQLVFLTSHPLLTVHSVSSSGCEKQVLTSLAQRLWRRLPLAYLC